MPMKKLSYKYGLNLLIACLLSVFITLSANASSGTHFVTNYAQGEIKKGAQTWQIGIYDDSWVYFANKNGVIQYDGMGWRLLPISNKLDVRSVYVSKAQGRIYVGGINEFGYFTPDERGVMCYTSLSVNQDEVPHLNNIWGIFEYRNMLYVQGDNNIMTVVGDTVKGKMIETNIKMRCSNVIGGMLYVGAEDGLYVLAGEKVRRAIGSEALSGKRIVSILPYKNYIVVTTARDGVYLYDNETVKPFVTGCEEYLSKNEVFSVAMRDDKIAFGTVLKGVIIVDLSKKSFEQYDESNGLQNNTVLSLAFDSHGNLWAGLDSGIDYIWLSMPVGRLFKSHSIGAGYAASYHNGKLYLGTNRGLFVTPFSPNNISMEPDLHVVPESGGQVWALQKIDGDLFCMHDHGLYLVDNGAIRRIGNFIGAWSVQKIEDGSGRVYVGTYDGVYIIKKINGVWTQVARVDSLNTSTYNFAQESPNVLWIRESGEGVLRAEVDLDNYRQIRQRFYSVEDGLPTPYNTFISKVDGEIVFSTEKGFYIYDKTNDTILPDTIMNNRYGGALTYSAIFQSGYNMLTLSGKVCMNYNRLSGASSSMRMLSSKVEPLMGWEKIEVINDTLFVLPNYYGFAYIYSSGTTAILEYKDGKTYAAINTVSLSNLGDSIIYARNYFNKTYVPEISYDNNSVKFRFGEYDLEDDGAFRYECRLQGREEWMANTSKIKEYTNLEEGDYVFELMAICADGEIYTDSFQFKILPPWYRTVWAIIAYVLIFILGITLFMRSVSRRVEAGKAVVAQEKDELMQEKQQEFERENERKERQIVELEKEKLREELNHKSQEMANLLMNFSRKNETLINIKAELQKILDKMKLNTESSGSEAKRMIVTLKGAIDTNMESDDLLKRFEDEFDLVHNGYMKKLRASYPDLSRNELLMCAYLKMNLSSKEIAPLLNMSVRGVETMRYRIRKKFGLEREDGLIEFFNEFDTDGKDVKKM